MAGHAWKAAALGLPEIVITDHYILDIDTYRITPAEAEEHFIEAESLTKETGVNVKVGLEVDYYPDREKEIRDFMNRFDFDFIIGAAHFVDGHGIPSEKGARNLLALHGDAAVCSRRSMETLEQAAASGLFDVMAHLDIIKKFMCALAGSVPFSEYAEGAQRVCTALEETGTGFEINCRGFDHSCGEQYPGPEFLKLLAEYNIENITIGSDAHSEKHTGKYLGRGARALLEAGFQYISTFSRRSPTRLPLSSFDTGDDY